MKVNASIPRQLLKRKLVTALFITASIAAFATLGDGDKKGERKFLPSYRTFSAKTFSLRTGYNYRTINLFNVPSQNRFIILNTTATFQKGNATYVLPLRKKVLLNNKIKFNPAG